MADIKLNYRLSIYTKGSIGTGSLDDAPIDGKVYGRKDGQWVEITNIEGNIPDVTEDGYYVRTKDGWVAIPDPETLLNKPEGAELVFDGGKPDKEEEPDEPSEDDLHIIYDGGGVSGY